MRTLAPILVLASLIGGPVACRRPEEPPSAPPPPSAAEPEEAIKRVAAEALPPLDAYLPPLDDGRLRVAPPHDWSRASRDREYLAQFYLDRSRRAVLPRIRVTVEPTDFDEPRTLSEDSLSWYAERLAGELAQKFLAEPLRPMIIGRVPCVRYVLRTNFRFHDGQDPQTVAGERQVIKTFVEGRVYTVELHVYRGTIRQHRDAAYAVTAGLQFSAPAAAD